MLSTNVRVKTVKGKNKIEIEFGDETELNRIVEMLKDGKQPKQDATSFYSGLTVGNISQG